MTQTVNRLASDISYCDLEFLGRSNAIATGILSGRGGVALVDPGPSTCLATLERCLEAQGIKLNVPYRSVPAINTAIAFFTDPWGTYIELTEGLDKVQ